MANMNKGLLGKIEDFYLPERDPRTGRIIVDDLPSMVKKGAGTAMGAVTAPLTALMALRGTPALAKPYINARANTKAAKADLLHRRTALDTAKGKAKEAQRRVDENLYPGKEVHTDIDKVHSLFQDKFRRMDAQHSKKVNALRRLLKKKNVPEMEAYGIIRAADVKYFKYKDELMKSRDIKDASDLYKDFSVMRTNLGAEQHYLRKMNQSLGAKEAREQAAEYALSKARLKEGGLLGATGLGINEASLALGGPGIDVDVNFLGGDAQGLEIPSPSQTPSNQMTSPDTNQNILERIFLPERDPRTGRIIPDDLSAMARKGATALGAQVGAPLAAFGALKGASVIGPTLLQTLDLRGSGLARQSLKDKKLRSKHQDLMSEFYKRKHDKIPKMPTRRSQKPNLHTRKQDSARIETGLRNVQEQLKKREALRKYLEAQELLRMEQMGRAGLLGGGAQMLLTPGDTQR